MALRKVAVGRRGGEPHRPERPARPRPAVHGLAKVDASQVGEVRHTRRLASRRRAGSAPVYADAVTLGSLRWSTAAAPASRTTVLVEMSTAADSDADDGLLRLRFETGTASSPSMAVLDVGPDPPPDPMLSRQSPDNGAGDPGRPDVAAGAGPRAGPADPGG